MRTGFIAVSALLLTTCLAVPAKAGAGSWVVKKHISSARRQFWALSEKDGSKKVTSVAKGVIEIAAAFIHSEELGRNVFKDHWDGMTASQQERALKLMGRLVETNYAIALYKERKIAVKYLHENTVDFGRVVGTEFKTRHEGRPYTFLREYRLRVISNSWRCFDYSNDGVGLTANYRAQINRIIKKRGVDGLFERMEKTAQKTEARFTGLLKDAAK